MSTTRNKVLALIGLVLLTGGVLLSGGTTHGAPPPNQDVRVINTTAEPVPTIAQGTTNVAGTVQAKQNGTWNVGILGTPTVQIDNSKANPMFVRDVDGPGRQPFQYEVELTVDPGFDFAREAIPVPEGKLMVIEQVSALGFADPAQKLNFSLETHVAPDLVLRRHLLQTNADATGATARFMTSQSVRIYADVPSASARVDRSDKSEPVKAWVLVSGYFINKQ